MFLFSIAGQQYTQNASEVLKRCIHVCSKQRKHSTMAQNLGKMVKKVNYDNYTNGKYTFNTVTFLLCYT